MEIKTYVHQLKENWKAAKTFVLWNRSVQGCLLRLKGKECRSYSAKGKKDPSIEIRIKTRQKY